MLSVDECKKILNRNSNKFTNSEIEKIRDFLWDIAQIEVKNIEKQEADENGSNNEPCK